MVSGFGPRTSDPIASGGDGAVVDIFTAAGPMGVDSWPMVLLRRVVPLVVPQVMAADSEGDVAYINVNSLGEERKRRRKAAWLTARKGTSPCTVDSYDGIVVHVD